MKSIFILLGSLLCFYSLSGQTWIRQNPFPQLSVMQDIHFDGQFGIAAGESSTLFTTNNAGVNWVPRKLPQQDLLYQAVLVVPGTNGQVMFAGGDNLLISRDNGETWEQANTSIHSIYKIQALPNGIIIIFAADQGARSEDHGESWVSFNMPGNNTSAGHFVNEMNGWVVYGGFDNNQVWVTTDGGDSWDALRDPLKHPVVSEVHMLNEQTGFLASRDFVYKTTDGGFNWIKMHDNAVNSIQDMHVVNENEIWTCLISGFIFVTLNGGTDWEEIDPNVISSNKTSGIYADADGNVWVAGKFVSILHSPDYGTNWTDQIPNAKGIMYQAHFINEDIGIVGGSGGTLLKTVNGGASWDKINFDVNENFYAVQMLSEQAIVIGSSSGKIFGSADQGNNWSIAGENLGQITDLHCFSVQSAVVTAESGKIYKTTDGGVQWDEVYTGAGDLLFGLDFVGPQKGWACGWYGQILHTENGGTNWVSQHYDGRNQFVDIHFTSENEGWVVSSSFTDTIWHTTNGGQDWMPSVLPRKIFWRSVSFSSQDTGWVAGGSAGFGIILRTNNGGLTWTTDHESPEALFGLYAVPGKETAWSTGVGGNIVKYSPCTFDPQLAGLTGDLMPCQRDTVIYSVTSSDVDLFEWTYPSDWLVYGNSNTSVISLIVGALQGEVSVQGKDACGNTTDQLALTASPIAVPEAVITENNGVLSCNLDSGFYQWLLDGSPVPGATEQSYTPVASGIYHVVVTILTTGCLTRSNAINVIINAVGDSEKDLLQVYPNPASGLLSFSFPENAGNYEGVRASIINIDGKLILENRDISDKIDVSNLKDGLYILIVESKNRIFRKELVVKKGN